MLSHADARRHVIEACTTLARSGVMSPSGHGNLSCRVDAERMLLTGTGLSKLPEAEDVALVGFSGVVEEGHLLASVAEIVGMHAAAYRARGEAAAVVHTHSPAVTAFALAHAPLPCRYEALLRQGQDGIVPVVPWAPRGSPALGQGIAHVLDAHPRTSALLLANHGLLAFAATPGRAASLVIALEEAARAELAAVLLGGAKEFPPGALEQIRASMGDARRSAPGQADAPAPG